MPLFSIDRPEALAGEGNRIPVRSLLQSIDDIDQQLLRNILHQEPHSLPIITSSDGKEARMKEAACNPVLPDQIDPSSRGLDTLDLDLTCATREEE